MNKTLKVTRRDLRSSDQRRTPKLTSSRALILCNQSCNIRENLSEYYIRTCCNLQSRRLWPVLTTEIWVSWRLLFIVTTRNCVLPLSYQSYQSNWSLRGMSAKQPYLCKSVSQARSIASQLASAVFAKCVWVVDLPIEIAIVISLDHGSLLRRIGQVKRWQLFHLEQRKKTHWSIRFFN